MLIGGLYAWTAAVSHSMNADGISYLDMGDAYLHGDWQMAINAVWSPMYAWILGFTLRILQPPMQWEFPVVHLVNFLVFLLALFCFEFFWRQMMTLHSMKITAEGVKQWLGFSDWALLSLGYLLFMMVSLVLIEIWAVTPDLLMSAFVYLAAGLIVQIRLGMSDWNRFIGLGIILGLGYLAKAIMFPVTILLLGVTFLSIGNIRLAVPRVFVAGFCFLVVVAPYVALISVAQGSLTIGEAGAFTYAKHVNGVPFHHWQGNEMGNGSPVHPTRQIFGTPPIYEFGTPIGGTYPVAYNPSYWYTGLTVNFDWGQQIRAVMASALFYLELFSHQFGALSFGIILLYIISPQYPKRFIEIFSHWGFVLIALVMLAFYGVVAVIGRYIGVFVALFWANLLAEVRLVDTAVSRRLITITSWLMIAFLGVTIIAFSLAGYGDFAGGVTAEQQADVLPPPNWPGEVAEALLGLGIQAGDPVGIIGYGFDSFWARLARVRIVAEMPISAAEPFWVADSALQDDVIQAFADTGAKAIVAEDVPSYASLPHWQQVGHSNYFIYLLQP